MTHALYANCPQPGAQPPVMGDFPGQRHSNSMTLRLDSLQHPNFQFSKCTGRKKAVCVSCTSPDRDKYTSVYQ
jgi:hypothetical protein